ncbi:MAG: HD domain-containing protein [candidate division Zixibacteria bacterium]|nr:HD domain-containing protein [Candidatus Tariuqbacter arcticus]
MTMINQVLKELDLWVGSIINEYSAFQRMEKIREKVIHDPIWGTTQFSPIEVFFLDCPLVQRLRDIKQTGLAFLVYPTANHTRFDHTLGVMALVQRIIETINHRFRMNSITESESIHMRLAALFHDVGHAFFSHASERIYSNKEFYKKLKYEFHCLTQFKPKPHELISYYILKTNSFRRLVDRLVRTPSIMIEDLDINIDFICDLIIGLWTNNPSRRFLYEIINGPLDADKLDYLARDAYFAGLSVVYDLERYINTVSLDKEKDNSKALRIPLPSINALEQIILSKMMLYSYIYHHHKIISAEGMLRDQYILFSSNILVKDNYPSTSCFFNEILKTDSELIQYRNAELTGKDDMILLRMLFRRILLKRAFCVSRVFVKDYQKEKNLNSEMSKNFGRLCSDMQDDANRAIVLDEFYNTMLKKIPSGPKKDAFRIEFISIQFPESPDFKEVTKLVVPVRESWQTKNGVPFKSVFPLTEWVNAYSNFRWIGYFFALDGYRYYFAEVVSTYLKKKYDLEFNEIAHKMCKFPEEDKIHLPWFLSSLELQPSLPL